MLQNTDITHACPGTRTQPRSTIVRGGMQQGPFNEGQGGADGM